MLLSQFTPTNCRLGCAAALALALGLAGCERPQAEPATAIQAAPPAAADYYFLNGQAATKLIVESLDAKKIVRVNVLNGKQATDYMRDANALRVVLVQTQ